MTAEHEPGVLGPRHRFADELKSARELHEPSALTQTALARQARTSKSTISRIEQGAGHIPPELPPRFDAIFGTDGAFKRLYADVVAADFPSLYQRRMTLERSAVEIREWSQAIVPGLLQTPDYAAAILRRGDPRAAEAEISADVRRRMTRQELLKGPTPPVLRVVLCESVIRRLLASRDVMRAQFQALLTHSSQPTISVRVLPLDAEAHLLLDRSATFLTGASGTTVICVEAYRTAGIVDDPEHVRAAEHAYDEITGDALSRQASTQLIRDQMEKLT